jgi:hypothetical protein
MEKKFEELLGVTINEWEYDESDIIWITKLLNDDPRKLLVLFDEQSDGFDIYEVKI